MTYQPAPQSFAALRHPGARAYLIGTALAVSADIVLFLTLGLITRTDMSEPHGSAA